VSKLKIEHGISRVKRAKLQTYIDQTVADDITLMADATDNEPHYIVNELLRFALAQSEEFQKLKAEQDAKSPQIAGMSQRLALAPSTPQSPVTSVAKDASEVQAKVGTPEHISASHT